MLEELEDLAVCVSIARFHSLLEASQSGGGVLENSPA